MQPVTRFRRRRAFDFETKKFAADDDDDGKRSLISAAAASLPITITIITSLAASHLSSAHIASVCAETLAHPAADLPVKNVE